MKSLPIALATLLALAAAAPAATGSRYDIASNLAKLKARPAAAEWSFAVLGDSRSGLGVLGAALGRIEQFKPAFSLYSGDLVGESDAGQWRDALAVLDREVKDVPIFPVVGNHETYKEGIGRFLLAFGSPSGNQEPPIDYSFDHGGARFLMMDNSREGKGREGFSDAQMAWLEGKLDSAPPLTFVVAHKPPWTDRWEHAFGNNSRRFMAILEKHRVTAGIFGHIHFYDRHEMGGVTYLVTGGAGAPLYHWDGEPDAGNPRFFHSPKGVKAHNFGIVTVKGRKASFKVYTDQAKLAKLRPRRSAGLDLAPGDFELWDSGVLEAAGAGREPAGARR